MLEGFYINTDHSSVQNSDVSDLDYWLVLLGIFPVLRLSLRNICGSVILTGFLEIVTGAVNDQPSAVKQRQED